MKLVKQQKRGECGVACLATILEMPLDDVLQHFPDCHDYGLNDDDMIGFLADHGVPALSSTQWPKSHCKVPAIVTVPSLNEPGYLHYIVWDGKEYLDPSPGELQYPKDGVPRSSYLVASWASVILLWPRQQ